MTTSTKRGFTLIEMLIVIAIVGILASLVLVGLGPVQRQGRDARRISDLRQVQTALELHFAKLGNYPQVTTWADLKTAIVNAGIGVSNLPNDPSSGKNYFYGSDGISYVIGATLEDVNNPRLSEDVDGTVFGVNCDDPVYCIQL